MSQQARGRVRGLNLGYSVCLAFVLAFVAMLLFLLYFTTANADANSLSLDERAGISSSSRVAGQQNSSDEASASSDKSKAATNSSEAAKSDANAGSSASGSGSSLSKADASAVIAGATVGGGVISGKYATVGKTHTVTYRWKNAPSSSVALYDAAGSRQFIFLPTAQEVRAGTEFTVDGDYREGTSYYLKVDDTVVGKFVFSGWSITGTETMPDEDLEITGTWTYESIEDKADPTPDDPDKGDSGNKGDSGDKGESGDPEPDKGDSGEDGDGDDKAAKHIVSYSWTSKDSADSNKNLPTPYNAYFEDEGGNQVEPTVPADESVAEGTQFQVDEQWFAGKRLYVVDLKGNRLSIWTFSGWSLSGTQTMGTSDIEIVGSWSSAVVTYAIKYEWENAPDEGTVLYEGDAEAGGKAHTVKLPEATEKSAGLSMELDDEFQEDAEYVEYNSDNTIRGYWTFGGWESDDADVYYDSSTGKYMYTIGQKDITFKAKWTFRSE